METNLLYLHPLLAEAVQSEASDIHLASGQIPMFRCHGKMQRVDMAAISQEDIELFLESIMPDIAKKTFKRRWETDFSFTWENTRFRANVFRQTLPNGEEGLGVVLRIIPASITSLEDLNMPTILKDIALLPQGLVLVTGPTGSGKSTTLAAMVDYINEQTQGHIITIEDPIEFIHTSKNCLIRQRELHRDTQQFSTALLSALREDPDVILVGELRDLETIRAAITAAETGHLVLATLHTQSAVKTIHRIIDVFPGDERDSVRAMLSESLAAVIAQTLVPAVSHGRVAAVEILMATPAVRHLIREDKAAQIVSAMQTGQAFGMQTLEQHLQQLSSQGLIS